MRVMRVAVVALSAALLAAAVVGAQSSALGRYLTAKDKNARSRLRKIADGRPSVEKAKTLLANGFARKKLEPGLHHATFESGGETWKYTVQLPMYYDGRTPFDVIIDAGHISLKDQPDRKAAVALGNYLRQTRESGSGERVIGVRPRIFDALAKDGRYARLTRSGTDEIYRLVAPIFLDLLRTIRLRYTADPDRVFLTGISMSGYWTWRLGADLPGEWAGIIPISSVTQQVKFGFENFRGLPVFILHAKDDLKCEFSHAKLALDRLTELKAPVRHHFLEQGGHIAPFRSFGRAWRGMKDVRRDTAPREIHLRLQHAGIGPVHWLEVVELKKPRGRFELSEPAAAVDAVVGEDNTLTVTAEGVKRLKLWLSPALLDLARPVRVVVNGKTVWRKKPKPEGRIALAEARRRGDTGVFYPAVVELKVR